MDTSSLTWAQLGFDPATVLPDAIAILRLGVAALMGALLGYERERSGKAAGIRTHMLVCVGAALFVVASLETGASPGDLTRVIQGVATGIGFVGAGSIIKQENETAAEVTGVTTAAGIWITAAIGVAIGAGRLLLPLAAGVLAFATLTVVGRIEDRFEVRQVPPKTRRRSRAQGERLPKRIA